MSSDLDLEELAEELSDFAPAEQQDGRSARQERIIAGFENIQRFVDEHKRLPLHGEGRDIFERLYAVRLDGLRAQAECRALLEPLDRQGLLGDAPDVAPTLDEEGLLVELAGIDEPSEIEQLVHVKRREDMNRPDEIAVRKPCRDFARFKPLFAQVQKDLKAGLRKTKKFERKSEIELGRYFIVSGQMAYVAERGELFVGEKGHRDARLRVIFDNGTESNMLMRSLQRQLQADAAGRRITEPDAGPLFGSLNEEGDEESGTIYVLRSNSQDPRIKQARDHLHKIGVTGNDVETRIAQAKVDPTFLLADVEVVATYELFNINRTKLENLLHKFFEPARLDIEMKDRFGNPFRPREWFLAPLSAIDTAVQRVMDGTIVSARFDVVSGRVVEG